MTLSKGYVLGDGQKPLDARFNHQAILTRNAGDAPRSGVLWGALGPLAATSGMALMIPDQVVFAISRGNTDGVNFITVNGAYTVPIEQAPGANSRIDIVYVKHGDVELGDSDSMPTIGVLKGDAAPNPAAKSLATIKGAVEIGRLQIAAGVTATNAASGVTLTNTIPGTSLVGTPIRYRNTAEMNADLPKLIDGTFGYIKGGELSYVRGGTWTPISNGDTGWIPLTLPSNLVGDGASYRLLNGVVYFAGTISMKTGQFPGGYTDAGNLPPGFRPTSAIRAPIGMFSGYVGNLVISTAGAISIGASADRTASAVYLGGVSYPRA